MTVADDYVASICAVSSKTSLRAAAEAMAKQQVSLLLVRDGGRSVGVLTDRDLVLGLADASRDADASRVGESMTSPAVVTRRDAPLSESIALMRSKGVRRLPVLDARSPAIGILAADAVVCLLADETRALAAVAAAQLPARHAVAGAGRRPPGDGGWRSAQRYLRGAVSLPAGATLAQVAAAMKARCVGCIIVVGSAGDAIGILTDRDLAVRAVAAGHRLASTPAAAIMSFPLVSAEAQEPLSQVLEKMTRHGVRHIPILRDGRLLGMVTLDDLLVRLGRELVQLGQAAPRGQRSERRSAQIERLRRALRGPIERLHETVVEIGARSLGIAGRRLDALRERRRPEQS